MENTKKYLRFQVGAQWYGISIDNVLEVSYFMMLNELPVADPAMLGLMTMRDEVIPVIDLRVQFGVIQPTYKLDTPIIAARTSQGIVGLVVDNADTVETVPEVAAITYQGNELPYLSGAAKLDEGLLLLLNIDQFTVEFSPSRG
jgi:purine-binding chemotaxis protein CheW